MAPILLPLIAFILLLRLVQLRERCWRSAILTTAVLWSVGVAVITETLSLFHALTFGGVCLSWGVAIALLVGFTGKQRLASWRFSLSWQFSLQQTLWIGSGVSIAALVGLISWVAPPNNWDSMAYVMPRVMHWIQNHSVAHYPTHYPAQLYNSPWAEFVVLQFQLLTGGDRFANIPHWLSFVGSLIGVSLITKQLGGNLQAQLFAMIFCATIPVGILHASTPKNTYIVAFWLVCAVFYGLVICHHQLTWRLTFLLSASFSLAVLTKGSAYIYALSFIGMLLALQIYRQRFALTQYLLVAIFILMSLNLGHYWRNWQAFGSPISTYPDQLKSELYSLSAFLSNVVKNISLHLTIPWIGGSGWVDQGVIQVHRLLNISPLDHRTTWGVLWLTQPENFTVNSSPLFEDTAGNPVHFWLIVIAIVGVLSQKKLRTNWVLMGYLMATLSAFFLFCFLLKWQPWHSRLHLPIFVWMSPVVGIVVAMVWHPKIAQYAFLGLILATLPYLLFNDLRPVVGESNIFNRDRVTQYFAARPSLLEEYQQVTHLAQQHTCRDVGFVFAPGVWEYPLWVLLEEDGQQHFRIQHLAVTNRTHRLPQAATIPAFNPCSIIAVGSLPIGDRLTEQNHEFQLHWELPNSQEQLKWYVRSDGRSTLPVIP